MLMGGMGSVNRRYICRYHCSCVAYRTLETVIHKMEENAQDLHELQSQVGMKHTAMMSERELAADARDQALKCMLSTNAGYCRIYCYCSLFGFLQSSAFL